LIPWAIVNDISKSVEPISSLLNRNRVGIESVADEKAGEARLPRPIQLGSGK
jgi:hypothetical protein